MTRNHLPGGADLEAFGRPLFAETTFDGVGFGLRREAWRIGPRRGAGEGAPYSVGEGSGMGRRGEHHLTFSVDAGSSNT